MDRKIVLVYREVLTRYKVKHGDTLYTIARHYNLALEHLAEDRHGRGIEL